jgi:hypothetical protein
LVGGYDPHPFDVAASVDEVHEDVADGLAGVVTGHPRPGLICIPGQHLDGSGFVVSNVVQSVLPILLARGPLVVTKGAQVLSDGWTELDVAHQYRVLSIAEAAPIPKRHRAQPLAGIFYRRVSAPLLACCH